MIIPDPEAPEQRAIDDETGRLCPGVWVIAPNGEAHHVGYAVHIGAPDSTEGGANAGVAIYHPDPEMADAAARWLSEGATVIIAEVAT